MRLFSAEAMRRVDARAVELGYPSLLLMEAAGRAVAEATHRLFPKARVLVLAGKGNNGGDGLVAARWLAEFGHPVSVRAAEGQKGDAAAMREALLAYGLRPEPLFPLRDLSGFDLVVDALFGTGLTRALAGEWAELVERVNASGLPVVAVDLPSGVPFAPHVRAAATVALAGLKGENLFSPGRDAGGELWLAPIGMPPAAYEAAGETPRLLLSDELAGLFPERPTNAHKGSVGRVLVAGGYATYTGAPALAALGAYRAGAGLVYVAYPEGAAVQPPLEAVRIPVSTWAHEALALA
ncbi:MAG TPA: NAD(P)H-hydrate epimerase, partial [Oceanithermus sp.]|nr:NAD(P)H-hydrate epimerase [Oceanithermus sp.]